MIDKYLGIDIGGTKILSGLVDKQGTVTRILYSKTLVKKGREDLLGRLKKIIKGYLDTNSPIKGIGISTGGMVDFERGEVIYSTSLLPDWKGLNLKKIIEKEFSIELSGRDKPCSY